MLNFIQWQNNVYASDHSQRTHYDYKKKSRTGPDDIPYRIIHEIFDVLGEPLKDINQSLETGTYPEFLKLTKYVQIPKKKGKILLSDMRPIALTSVSLKSLRVTFERITFFLN